jgi:hypothetical protein
VCSPETAEEVDAYDEGQVQEDRHEEEGARHGIEAAVNGVPGEARGRRRGDEHGVHRMQLLGQRLVGGQPLVQRHEHNEVVRDTDGPEELACFRPADLRGQDGPDEVADHGEVRRRVGHLAQSPLSPRQPLPVYLELEREERQHERAPQRRVRPRGREGGREADDEEHGRDQRREEEVDANRVKVLAPDGLEVEDALEHVGEGRRDKHGGRDQPQRDVDHGRHVEEPHRRAHGQGAPQDGLAAEPEAHAEAADRETQQERPHLVLGQQDVLRILQQKQQRVSFNCHQNLITRYLHDVLNLCMSCHVNRGRRDYIRGLRRAQGPGALRSIGRRGRSCSAGPPLARRPAVPRRASSAARRRTP